MSFIRIVPVVILTFICKVTCQEDDEGPYKGKLIGKLNSYHHQVSGDIYAVDKYTILLTSFNYDGNGADTFFWAGAANRPGPQGFIIPDEHRKTNVLSKYYNKDFTLILPDEKKITDIKWFAIYDIGSQNTFADIYIPEEFDPPSTQRVPQLTNKLNAISTIAIEILDAKQIKLIGLSYNGKGSKAYFWVGVGAQPVSKGTQVPDEYGYLDPLKSYNNKTIILELPGSLTIFNIDWFSIFDRDSNINLASIIIPEALNVPPSLIEVVPHKDALPNCIQLHKDFQVSWEIFGPAITIQLAGMVTEDEYLAFGISGSQEKSQMIGADVAVGYINGYQGFAMDYNITALTPCIKVLGQYKGVCKDELVGGQDNNQMNTAVRENGVNIITYRRSLISSDSGDKEFPTEGSVYVTWAMGKLDENSEPAFHDIYPKTDLKIELNPKEPIKSCSAFTRSKRKIGDQWSKGQIFDKAVRIFRATIGPSGGKKGYQAITGHASTALAWNINNLLAPELWLRRGLTYLFKVNGGNDPHSPEHYHPLIITDDPHGGYDRLTDVAQSKVRVLAGVEYSRRGRPKSTASGPLCLSKHKDDADRRLDDDFESFKKFNRSLIWSCGSGDPGILEFTPNSSWPDIVYYNSFTQANMGWKIHIIDSFNQRTNSSRKLFIRETYWFLMAIMLLRIYL